MCVSSKFKDKIDVPFWEKVHQEYMTGVKIINLESKYGYVGNHIYYYFSKLGLPRREKKPKPVKAINKDFLKSLWDKGQSKCRHCNEIKSIDVFTPKHGKSKDGAKVTRWYECHECYKEICRQKTGYYTKERVKTALELGYKQCPKCGETKDISEYSIILNKKGNKKVCSRCKECRRIESLAANMKQEHLERKRERDRIRAKAEENRERRNEASTRYRQTDKYKIAVERYSKPNKIKYYQEQGKTHCDLIHVNCCVCGRKEVKRVKPTMGRGYKERCSGCSIRGTFGLKFPERTIKEVACKSCGVMHMGKSTVSRCIDCAKELRKEQKKKQKHNHQHRKRARYYGCVYAPLNRKYIFERDNYKCYLCGIDVVLSKIYREDQATIDHVIPMSKGGAHTYDNVKTCCNKCNSKKGNSLQVSEGLAPFL
jgi:5-methylcytosine-specific restriction endonuclease McrA